VTFWNEIRVLIRRDNPALTAPLFMDMGKERFASRAPHLHDRSLILSIEFECRGSRGTQEVRSDAQRRVALEVETGGVCRHANSSHDVRDDRMLSGDR
jgi:hypothetical protein